MPDLDDTRGIARSTDPDTSHAAAASITGSGLDALVLAVIQGAGERGATLDDLEDACPNVKVVSLSPRPARLEEKGLVYDTGERRSGRSGRLQRVLRAVQQGGTRSLLFPRSKHGTPRTSPLVGLDVDVLANMIRTIDGRHDMGAGELAEALMPKIAAAIAAPQ